MWVSRAKWDWLRDGMNGWKIQYERAEMKAREALHNLDVERKSNLETARSAFKALGDTQSAQLQASLLRVQVNELKLERAALLVRLIPGLELQVPQVGKLDVASGPPGSDFEDLGDDLVGAAAAGVDLPLPSGGDPAILRDIVGVDEREPGLQPGAAVTRPPREA